MPSESPITRTGPVRPVTGNQGWRYLRQRMEALSSRVGLLERNRTPQPLRLGGADDAGGLTQVLHGHSPTYDQATGGFVPSPNLAHLVYHQEGELALTTSPPQFSRYPCSIESISAVVGTWVGGDVVFQVNLNGSPLYTITMTAQTTGQVFVTPMAIDPYTDLLTITVTNVGATGNLDLVVYIELGGALGEGIGP